MHTYHQIDSMLHVLCQIIAKANRTFVPPKEDDSHTNLSFDNLGQCIYGRWVEREEGKIILCFNLSAQSFEWRNDDQKVLQSHSIKGKTIVNLEDELANDFSVLGLSPNDFKAPLHFKIPDYDFSEEAMSSLNENALKEWQHYRQLANEACTAAMGFLQTEGETRIWPHHFDTCIYVEPNTKVGIGIGLAMKDSLAGEAYFYLAPYALNGAVPFDELADLPFGEWKITENWKGAFLRLSDIEGLSLKDQKEKVYTFLGSALARVLSIMH